MLGGKKAIIPLVAVLILAALLLPAFFTPPCEDAEPIASPSPAAEDGTQPLFPGLDREKILSVSLTAAEYGFTFDCESESCVSVNGRKADADVFSTLLDQVIGHYYDPAEQVSPPGNPVMTLTITAETGTYSAAFFKEDGRLATILTDGPGLSQTLVTEAWRVGTMLMTCEGTRIIDENGRESPAR